MGDWLAAVAAAAALVRSVALRRLARVEAS